MNGDGGGGLLAEDGKPVVYGLQAGEKSYADFKLTVTNPGGHSSRPGKTNAINQLAQALDRIAAYQFPAMHNELTLAYFKESLPKLSGPTARRSRVIWRTRGRAGDRDACRPIRIRRPAAHDLRGHADRRRPRAERLPQKAVANINCRIFPGVTAADVRETLAEVVADPAVAVTEPGSAPSTATPRRCDRT